MAYLAIQVKSTDTSSQNSCDDNPDQYFREIWIIDSPLNVDTLDITLPFGEVIMEVMNILDNPWVKTHHQSYFLPTFNQLETIETNLANDKGFD